MHNIFISCKESRIENNRSFYGCFNIGPFDSTQSLTIGNALRRTLLADCPGLGITSLQIDNVSHEYSTLPGMRESVLDLLLNLKEVVFTVKPVVPTTINSSNASLQKNIPYPLPPEGGLLHYVKEAKGVKQPVGGETSLLKPRSEFEIRRKNLLINNLSSVFTKTNFNSVRFASYPLSLKGQPFSLTPSVGSDRASEAKGIVQSVGLAYPQPQNPKEVTKALIKSNDIFNLLISKRKHLKKPLIGYLKVKGPGIIRAKDLKLPPFIQCVDGNQYIATLADDGFLSMKFILMEGKGYIIQKRNLHKTTFQEVPNQLIKKRTDFVNQIEKNLNINEIEKHNINISNLSNNNKTTVQRKTINNSYFNKQNQKSTFVNCKPLNLDCVFNPITKVSYIVEDFNNKLINDFNSSFNFANDVSSLIESSYYLQNLTSLNAQKVSKHQTIMEPAILSQNIVNLIDSYSKEEMQELLTYLADPPLQRSKSLNNIVLEIWTNGGIHPREALTIAFQNLSSLFLNLNKL